MGLLVEETFFVEVAFLVAADFLVGFLLDFLALVAGIMQRECIGIKVGR